MNLFVKIRPVIINLFCMYSHEVTVNKSMIIVSNDQSSR